MPGKLTDLDQSSNIPARLSLGNRKFSSERKEKVKANCTFIRFWAGVIFLGDLEDKDY